MEKEQKRISIIYILTGIILLLIIYLVIFSTRLLESDENKKEENDSKEVAESCTFPMIKESFNDIESNELLCNNDNKIEISDVALGGEADEVFVYYNPSENNKIKNVTFNGSSIVKNSSFLKFASDDDYLFVLSDTNTLNLVAYDKTGSVRYNLIEALAEANIQDQVLGTTLSVDNIDMNSFTFASGAITFNSTLGNCTNGVLGINYTINYQDGIFNNPASTSQVTC